MKSRASLFMYVGLIAVAFALLSFLLGLVGLVPDLNWTLINLGVGLLLLIGGGIANLDAIRERLHSGEARRVGRHGSSAIASTVLLLLILGMLAFLSTRYHRRFDWSQARVHSLSEKSANVLASLDGDVEVIAFFPAGAGGLVDDLLQKYEYESERIDFLFADPMARVDLVEKYQIPADQLERGVVRVQLGEESITIVGMVTEEKLTTALVRLQGTQAKKVYFLEGHNERKAVGEKAVDQDGFSQAARFLTNENYEVDNLLIMAVGGVPEDADVVILAGPTRPLAAQEHIALQQYLARGGSLLVTIDPRANTDLYPDLDGWGVRVGDNVVIDEEQGMYGQAASPLAGAYDGDHPITKGMREVTLFHMARSVMAKDTEAGLLSTLVMTGKNSWAETDVEGLFANPKEVGFDPGDHKGPVPLAVAGRPSFPADVEISEGAEPRIVVFGDSDFASNQIIQLYSNRDLFVNSVNWLLGDTEAISIRPAVSPASHLSMTAEQLSRLRFLSMLLLPEVIALVGVIVWWNRCHGAGR